MGDTDADARARLREAQLRATPPRVAVLVHLSRQPSPISHPEVCAALVRGGWNRGTLHRTLSDLTRAGLVRKRDLGDHLWRYEIIDRAHGLDEDEHPHFLCTRCGAVACLPAMEIELPSVGVPRVLTMGRFQLQIHGICDDCLA